MWYECQWDNSQSKSQFIKVNHFRSKYGLQHGALAHNEQQAIKGPKMTSVKPFKWDNGLIHIKNEKWENTYEPHQETKTTEHQIHDLGQVQTIPEGLNVFFPLLFETIV